MEELHDLRARVAVEVPGGFIRPHDRGTVREGARHSDPLLLTRTELRGLVASKVGEANSGQELPRSHAGVLRHDAGHQEGEFDVLRRAEDREQVVRLEDEAHPERAVLRLRPVAHPVQWDVLDVHLTLREVVEPAEAVQEGRLPAAGRPHHRDHLALSDLEVDAAEGVDPDGARVVHLVCAHRSDKEAIAGHGDSIRAAAAYLGFWR